MKLYDKLYQVYELIETRKPLILNLTNYVVQDFIANALLALGASPLMSESESELAELVNITDAVNLNIGTLNADFTRRALVTAQLASATGKHIILDPVGAGASHERTILAQELAGYATVIRGNASEIIAMADTGSHCGGVDSLHASIAGVSAAKKIVRQFGNIVVITGKEDYIVGPAISCKSSFGDELMTRVTGMGCVLGAVIAAFAVVEGSYQLAAYLAVIYYTLIAEQAKLVADVPASFKIAFIDCLYAPDWRSISKKLAHINYDQGRFHAG